MSNTKRSKVKEIMRRSKAIRGIEREEHFSNGGSVSEWRGKHSVTKNRHKESLKNKCRKKVSNRDEF